MKDWIKAIGLGLFLLAIVVCSLPLGIIAGAIEGMETAASEWFKATRNLWRTICEEWEEF